MDRELGYVTEVVRQPELEASPARTDTSVKAHPVILPLTDASVSGLPPLPFGTTEWATSLAPSTSAAPVTTSGGRGHTTTAPPPTTLGPVSSTLAGWLQKSGLPVAPELPATMVQASAPGPGSAGVWDPGLVAAKAGMGFDNSQLPPPKPPAPVLIKPGWLGTVSDLLSAEQTVQAPPVFKITGGAQQPPTPATLYHTPAVTPPTRSAREGKPGEQFLRPTARRLPLPNSKARDGPTPVYEEDFVTDDLEDDRSSDSSTGEENGPLSAMSYFANKIIGEQFQMIVEIMDLLLGSIFTVIAAFGVAALGFMTGAIPVGVGAMMFTAFAFWRWSVHTANILVATAAAGAGAAVSGALMSGSVVLGVGGACATCLVFIYGICSGAFRQEAKRLRKRVDSRSSSKKGSKVPSRDERVSAKDSWRSCKLGLPKSNFSNSRASRLNKSISSKPNARPFPQRRAG
jgi:hypothetical protein